MSPVPAAAPHGADAAPAFDAGSLTQKELDRYDAEALACLE